MPKSLVDPLPDHCQCGRRKISLMAEYSAERPVTAVLKQMIELRHAHHAVVTLARPAPPPFGHRYTAGASGPPRCARREVDVQWRVQSRAPATHRMADSASYACPRRVALRGCPSLSVTLRATGAVQPNWRCARRDDDNAQGLATRHERSLAFLDSVKMPLPSPPQPH